MSEIIKSGALEIDAADLARGVFRARTAEATRKALRLKVNALYYPLNGAGAYATIPLTSGSGRYDVRLYRQVNGKRYTAIGRATIRAKLEREDAAFLRPNLYVDYDPDGGWPALTARWITDGEAPEAAFETIRAFIRRQFAYDYVRAATVADGTLPDIERCWESRMGICQDLAALAACMLRSCGIPARLAIGRADGRLHAWTVVTLGERAIRYDPTAELGAIKNPTKYSAERWY